MDDDAEDDDIVSISVERDGVEFPVRLGEPRYTMGETVIRRVRRAITDGVLRSDDEFTAGKLGKTLGVGRIAASEGLHVLEGEGLVTVRKGANWRVV